MKTGSIGQRLRGLAAVVALAGLTVSCANPQQAATVAPPGFGKDPASRAERLVSYCQRLADKGELVTALGLCARAHEIDPEDPETMMKIAAILHKLERKQAAVQTYVALLELHPRHHEARYTLGKLYMEMGETSLAAMEFDHAMRIDPKDPRPYNALGILRDQAGEHQAAQALYRAALERNPQNHALRNNLGLSLALAGERDEAIEVLAELAVDPEAHQTVLRNLEAAYAARKVPAPAGMTSPLPAAADVEEAAPDALPGSGEPALQPVKSKMRQPRKAPGNSVDSGAPTPLYMPQPGPGAEREAPTAGDEHQQSGSGEAGPGSVILAAAERLLAPPVWADFEPGALIGSEPAPSPAPAAQIPLSEEAPQDGKPGGIDIDPMELGYMEIEPLDIAPGEKAQPVEYSLSLLLLGSGSGTA